MAGPSVRGMAIGVDLSRWQFWWEFNKASFLDLKSHLHASVIASDDYYMSPGNNSMAVDQLNPTRATIRNRVLPALNRALIRWDQRDITSSCMIAMAKIGQDHPNFKIRDIFAKQLQSRDQEIRETAALALGIAGQEGGLQSLIDMVEDNQQGRVLVDRAEVDERTRSFAAYAIGLLAYLSEDQRFKQKALQPLKRLLHNRKQVRRDLMVAAIQAIGLINPQGTSSVAKMTLDECLTCLEKFYREDVGAGNEIIRSHISCSIAKLHRSNPSDAFVARREQFTDLLLAELETSLNGKDRNRSIIQSAVLALGQLVWISDSSTRRAQVEKVILAYARDGADAQARYMALISLGKIGGHSNQRALLKILKTGSKALEKPWAAIALGVLVHDSRQRNPNVEIDATIGSALFHWFENLKNPDARGALAISLGLCRYTKAADSLRQQLLESKGQDELAGYLCIGLALMDDRRSVPELRSILESATRRPILLRQAATALGRLGDRASAEDLVTMLTTGSQNLAKLSAVSSGLALIGDRRSIDPLLNTLFDAELTSLSRAFAAVALGGISDKELLPWNTKIAANANYRSAVETLTDGQSGILDIL